MSLNRMLLLMLGAALLPACTTPPVQGGIAGEKIAAGEKVAVAAQPGPQSAQVQGFDLSARFSLQLLASSSSFGETSAPRQFSGRLQWQHDASGDRLFFTDPLGQGVADLQCPRQGPVVLGLADGSRREAAHPDELLAELLGAPLPLGELAAWVQAQPGATARVERDAAGRPARVLEAGWQLVYHYHADALLPSRLDAQFDEVLKMRLLIERWNVEPSVLVLP